MHTLSLPTGVPPKCPVHGTWLHWEASRNPGGYGKVFPDGVRGNVWVCDG